MVVQATEYWRDRLATPAYLVGESAKYARTSSQTVTNWERLKGNRLNVVTPRDPRAALSYFQLIEVGVVAAMRKAGVKLDRIRVAREYLSEQFDSQYPFVEYRFKTDGKNLFLNYDQITGAHDRDKLLVVTENGQFAWTSILSRLLEEFEYDTILGQVSGWKVAGKDSPVFIDPRIAFGAPNVEGIATWVIRGRWQSGESIADIADDYDIAPQLVVSALKFEGVEVNPERPNLWVN